LTHRAVRPETARRDHMRRVVPRGLSLT